MTRETGHIAAAGADRVSEVYDKLRELIVWGKLAPGTRVIETEIADRLGVSRTPVRSALHRLLQEGFVAVAGEARRPRLVIAPLTKGDASELFHIIGVLEGLAGWYAAQLDPVSRSGLATELKRVNCELAAIARAPHPDGKALYDLDVEFHGQYVEAASRPRLQALHAATRPQAERYIRVYLSALVEELPASVDEHVVIIGAIEAGEADAAQAAIHTNWRNAAKRFRPVIDRIGEQGTW
jgi:DNA-binding GntR family transcriptional regulator